MPSVAVPTTGDITLAHITAAFPGVTSPGSLLSYLGVHPSAPSTGSIDMLSFRGLNAVSPTHSAATLYDTGAAGTAKATAILGASSLGISTAAGGTLALALNLKTYLTNAAYQGNVTYAASPALPTGVSLNSATGVLSLDPATVNTGSTALAYTRTITATNKWGNTSALAVTFDLAGGGAGNFIDTGTNGVFSPSGTGAGGITGAGFSPGGAGYTGNGSTTGGSTAYSAVNGGVGGVGIGGGGAGGFGGGGAGQSQNGWSGGGGGGYTGGNGSSTRVRNGYDCGGDGGTCFGSGITNLGTNTGDGYVMITGG